MPEIVINGSDGVLITVTWSDEALIVGYRVAGSLNSPHNFFVAMRAGRAIGSAVVPFAQGNEGSTVFLPFNADLLLCAETGEHESRGFIRRWEEWRWSEREQIDTFALPTTIDEIQFRIPRSLLGPATTIDFVLYAKDPRANDGWGWFWGCSDRSVDGGIGDKYIPHYHELRLDGGDMTWRSRQNADRARVRIYQLFVRLFGNTNETRKQNGTLAENGVGKFADINDTALHSIREMGFTDVWLSGVLQQATATDYSEFGQPADDTDLLKGLAGSPYAIKDYFDVCPDYAVNPGARLDEFAQLVERLHAHGLKAIIDLVANHVARSYESCIKPDCNFGTCGGAGAGDDKTRFFDPHNNFFYLTPDANGPPLRLPTFRDSVALSPTCQIAGSWCDGLFEGETTFGRVTGNNAVTWSPQLTDWYETVKLNYGFDFTDPSKSRREYPNAWTPDKPIPDTWRKIDQVMNTGRRSAWMDSAAIWPTWCRRKCGHGRSRRLGGATQMSFSWAKLTTTIP